MLKAAAENLLEKNKMADSEASQTSATVEASQNPEPLQEDPKRLIISKIVCENFKSYAGVKELGPFHKVSV